MLFSPDYCFSPRLGERVAWRKTSNLNFIESPCNSCWLKIHRKFTSSIPENCAVFSESNHKTQKHPKHVRAGFMCASRASILAFTIFSSSSLRQTFFHVFSPNQTTSTAAERTQRDCWRVCDERASDTSCEQGLVKQLTAGIEKPLKFEFLHNFIFAILAVFLLLRSKNVFSCIFPRKEKVLDHCALIIHRNRAIKPADWTKENHFPSCLK